MSMDVSKQIRTNLMEELAKIEGTSDLKNLTILSRVGMKIATSQSSDIDADPITASSAALIDVGVRFNSNVDHGDLKEILIRGINGYSILMYIDQEYMTFAGISNLARIGYYLEFLRVKCKLFSFILAGGRISDELKASMEAETAETEAMDDTLADMFESDATTEGDLSSMDDVLSFLNDWGGDDVPQSGEVTTGIVGIGDEFMIGEDFGIVEGGSVGLPEPIKKVEPKEESSTFEFPIYTDEVPPVPLDDVEALELQSEQSEDVQVQEDTAAPVPEYQPPAASTINIPDEPNFDNLASEYDEFDLDLSEEDAMFEALNDLGYTDKKKE